MSYDNRLITLLSKGDNSFEIPFKYAMMSETIKALSCFPTDEDDLETWELSSDPIPLPPVSEPTLKKIIEYCIYHTDNAEINQAERDSWNAEYMRMEDQELFDLILASNYLEIHSLLHLGCETVADIIKKSHTPEEIRRRFKTKGDSAPPEGNDTENDAWIDTSDDTKGDTGGEEK